MSEVGSSSQRRTAVSTVFVTLGIAALVGIVSVIIWTLLPKSGSAPAPASVPALAPGSAPSGRPTAYIDLGSSGSLSCDPASLLETTSVGTDASNECVSACSKNADCRFSVVEGSTCRLYSSCEASQGSDDDDDKTQYDLSLSGTAAYSKYDP